MSNPTAGAGGAEQEREATVRRVIAEQLEALNAHDVAGFAAFYAEDAVVADPQYPEPLRGRAAIERDMAEFLTAFPDLTMTVTSTLSDGPVAAVEATMAGTHTGPLTLPTGEIPATGRRMEFHGAVFSRLDEHGKIVEERRYYDPATTPQQLGLS